VNAATSHEGKFAGACTDRFYLIDSGRIVFSGDWGAFDATPDLKTRYLAV